MRAKRSLGQNFLTDDTVIRKIVDALDLDTGDTVIEIGPGRGALTDLLLKTGASIIAIEIDRLLVPALRTQFHFEPNFSVIEADVLEADLGAVLVGARPPVTKLVANLPYYISTAILQKLSADRHLFSRIVLMFQREVVDRITAAPGNSERGFLTILAEAAFEIEHLFDVTPDAFTPRPKVQSSVIALTPKPASIADGPKFRKLVSSAFAQKRKTLLNNLKHLTEDAAAKISAVEIDPGRRAETLSLDEWVGLYGAFN